MPPHRVTAVSPSQRHRNLATDTAGTHEYRVPGPALEVQNLQPLTDQRVERMSDDNETQIITGRRGTMPPPSVRPASWFRRHAAWVSPPRAPEAESNFPRTSDGGSGVGAVTRIGGRRGAAVTVRFPVGGSSPPPWPDQCPVSSSRPSIRAY